jgi:hypothetical protein
MKNGVDLVELFFPNLESGEQPASALKVTTQAHWSQVEELQSALEGQKDVLKVFIVSTSDEVKRMVAAWPWDMPSHQQLPFNGVAMTANSLPGMLPSAMLPF